MAQRRSILPLTVDDVAAAAGAGAGASPQPTSRLEAFAARTLHALRPRGARWIPDWWVNLRQWVHETWTERSASAAEADGLAEWFGAWLFEDEYYFWSANCCLEWRDCLMGYND